MDRNRDPHPSPWFLATVALLCGWCVSMWAAPLKVCQTQRTGEDRKRQAGTPGSSASRTALHRSQPHLTLPLFRVLQVPVLCPSSAGHEGRLLNSSQYEGRAIDEKATRCGSRTARDAVRWIKAAVRSRPPHAQGHAFKCHAFKATRSRPQGRTFHRRRACRSMQPVAAAMCATCSVVKQPASGPVCVLVCG